MRPRNWSRKLTESAQESFEEWKKDNNDVRMEVLQEQKDEA
jgi:uncharacterized membrane protein (DUF106 family)